MNAKPETQSANRKLSVSHVTGCHGIQLVPTAATQRDLVGGYSDKGRFCNRAGSVEWANVCWCYASFVHAKALFIIAETCM